MILPLYYEFFITQFYDDVTITIQTVSTPTAIEGIDAPAAQKAVKTIENGKIVIIKNGEKFDLSGRKVE